MNEKLILQKALEDFRKKEITTISWIKYLQAEMDNPVVQDEDEKLICSYFNVLEVLVEEERTAVEEIKKIVSEMEFNLDSTEMRQLIDQLEEAEKNVVFDQAELQKLQNKLLK